MKYAIVYLCLGVLLYFCIKNDRGDKGGGAIYA